LAESPRLIPGLVLVVASMLVLFTVPRPYFAGATFISTGCMLAAAWALGALRAPSGVRYASIGLGVMSGIFLYVIFFIGGAAIDAFHPFGVTSASESSIYSLIASPSNPGYLQVGLLFFDSAGYEAFFRGVLQKRLQGRIGATAAPVIALFDAGLHIATLNPIWVGGTFVTDLLWGLTCYYGKGVQASFTSHFLWDLAIFILWPVT
jgi:uncharacterized protein